jgi:hypothetical protein
MGSACIVQGNNYMFIIDEPPEPFL